MIHSLYLDENSSLRLDVPGEEYPSIISHATGLLWIDCAVDAGTEKEVRRLLTSIFQFHPVAIDNCFEPSQYARINIYKGYLFIIAHGLEKNGQDGLASPLELDSFVGQNYLVTVHTQAMPAIESVRQDLIEDPSLLQRGVAWLVHSIMDTLVDTHFPVIDRLAEQLDRLEDEALENPQTDTLTRILSARRDLMTIHRVAIPFREVMSRLSRDSFDQFKPDSQVYLRDVYDHLVRIISSSEELREVTESALTLYAMSQNNRTNEIIKVLTIVATVGIPPVMIASIYGMNFTNMPELDWRLGYLYALLVMAALSIALFLFFRRKKWL